MTKRTYAEQYKADLQEADLRRAKLHWADLQEADLRRAKLHWANLHRANLHRANLQEANLQEADLRGADLRGANLHRADLRGTDLRGANLHRADLRKTVLDPDADVPTPTRLGSFYVCEQEDGPFGPGTYIHGWRTVRSLHVGNTTYEPGKTYEAEIFSVCTETSCHPGIYLAPRSWLENTYPRTPLVRCCALLNEVVQAGDKYRAKRIHIVAS